MQIYKRSTFRPTFDVEKFCISKGYSTIAGIDEAGRGALSGPLYVGLVVYKDVFIFDPAAQIMDTIDDSKRLSPQKRGELLGYVEKYSEFALTEIVSHRIIDKQNVNRATEYAIMKLLNRINVRPDVILLDGNFNFNLGIPVVPLIKGDTVSISIASASIVAKVKRDKIIEKFDLFYPGYGFDRNKGYGTLEHRRAIERLGPSPIHRKTYKPVSDMLNQSSVVKNCGKI